MNLCFSYRSSLKWFSKGFWIQSEENSYPIDKNRFLQFDWKCVPGDGVGFRMILYRTELVWLWSIDGSLLEWLCYRSLDHRFALDPNLGPWKWRSLPILVKSSPRTVFHIGKTGHRKGPTLLSSAKSVWQFCSKRPYSIPLRPNTISKQPRFSKSGSPILATLQFDSLITIARSPWMIGQPLSIIITEDRIPKSALSSWLSFGPLANG